MRRYKKPIGRLGSTVFLNKREVEGAVNLRVFRGKGARKLKAPAFDLRY